VHCGYYYDTETRLFYVAARYYSPELGRWISADKPGMLGLSATHLLGANLFAYCLNNPVNLKDNTGYGPVGAIIGGILGFGLGALLVPKVADFLKLTGWKRKAFIWAGVAALTGLGAYVGWYVGEAIFAVYQAGGAFALQINKAIAGGMARLVGGVLSAAKGNGWIINVGRLTLRIMTESSSRVNYFRLSMEGKGAMTVLGALSSDRALTHISITFDNIIKIIQTILKFK